MLQEIKKLNINHMVQLLTLKENDFNPYNTGLDLDTNASNVCRTMKQIESYFSYPLFVKGTRRNYTGGRAVIGFTEKGNELYQSIRIFVHSLDCMGIFEESKNS